MSKQPEEQWYRSQEWISNQDKRICKLTHEKDKKNVRWMGFNVVMAETDGVIQPRSVRFEIPAKDFTDAKRGFQKAYEAYVAGLNAEQDEMEKHKPKIVVPDGPRVLG